MNKITLVIIIIVLIVLGWWAFSNYGREVSQEGLYSEPEQQQGQSATKQAAQELVVNLSEQNDSGIMGTATFSDKDGKLKILLNLSGTPGEIARPAHIHLNNCADIGGVKYPLTFPVNGYSETTVDASLDEILSQLPLSVNVHKSPEEISVYVACGDIVAQ